MQYPKIRIVYRLAVVYSKFNEHLQDKTTNRILYHFIRYALKRNSSLAVKYFPNSGSIDLPNIVKYYDAILLPTVDLCTVYAMKGIENYDIPVIARAGPPHHIRHKPTLEWFKSCKVNHCFEHYPSESFYRYYPHSMPYTMVQYGLEPNLYEKVLPWSERITYKVGISGVLPKTDFLHTISKFRHPKLLRTSHHYHLRSLCNSLPDVVHSREIAPAGSTDDFPAILGNFRAAIAATSYYPTVKYRETAAAGCLTLMEVTEQNHAKVIGYEDMKTAVFINKDNYTKHIREFLDTPDNPVWEDIAKQGRKYTLEHLTNDHAVKTLVKVIAGLVEREYNPHHHPVNSA